MQPEPQHADYWVVRYDHGLEVMEANVRDGKLQWLMAGSERPVAPVNVTPIRKVDLSVAVGGVIYA